MPDTFDEQAAIAGEAAGLRPEQWPGLAHIFRTIAATERDRSLKIAAGLMSTPAYEQFERQLKAGADSAWNKHPRT